jgi:hypothetical protein
MFLDNKYTQIYYFIIDRAKKQNKIKLDIHQTHHIIPKSIGGTDNTDNLVHLTYKEHRVCHCLLIKMQTNTNNEIKMRHAYGFFNKHSKFNGPRYKRGKDNVFSSDRIIQLVKERMTNSNPMKNPTSQQKRVNSWKANRAAKDFIPTRVLKDKFITPAGIFKTKKEIHKVLNIPEWTLNTIYNNLDAYPVTNGRASKKIDHLNINSSKTWRENGFSLLAVSCL